ncbi:MAG: hypothetical protein H7345_06760 [Rubritepida sp.]|nr:hypothetical protein [Rubritepida sp.]
MPLIRTGHVPRLRRITRISDSVLAEWLAETFWMVQALVANAPLPLPPATCLPGVKSGSA